MSAAGPARRRPPRARSSAARRRAAALRLGVLTAAAAASALPSAAHAQELRYSITPTAEQLRFDNALGLENTYLYGGRAGVLFGRIVGLEGFYLTSHGTDARVADLYSRLNLSGTPPQNAGIDLSTYGANLVLNFGAGLVTPFVRGGGSIVRFSPNGQPSTDRIALQYAGGLRVGKPGGIRLSAYAEDVRLRVDRTLLIAIPTATGGAAPFDGDADKLRSNIAYGASLTIPLGGALGEYDDRPSSSLANLSLPLDAFAGVLDWNGATGLKAQSIAGVRTGLDFGPLVGVRAYYWRGVDNDFSRRDGVQSWGAEAQFNLNSGSGLTPFLIGGAGQVDFTQGGVRASGSSSDDTLRLRPADRTALIVGGGVKLPLTSFVSLTAAARDYVMTRDSSRLQDVNGTGQLRNNWQYTAGLSVGLGRRSPAKQVAARNRVDTVFVDSTRRRLAARADSARAESARADTVRLRESRTLVVTERGDTLRGAAADSALGVGPWARVRSAQRGEVALAPNQPNDTIRIAPRPGEATYATDRSVAVVVPREGEITVRYGPAGPAAGPIVTGSRTDADMRDEIRTAVRAAVREELGGDDATTRLSITTQPGDARSGVSTRRSDSRAAPAAMTRAEVRAEIRAAIRDELATSNASRVPVRKNTTDLTTPAAPAVAPTTSSSATTASSATTDAERERRMLDSVDARVSERLAAYARADAEARAREAEQRRTANGDVTRVEVRDAQPPARTRRAFGGATLYSGATFSGGAQALLGGRFDLGEFSASLPGFRLVPELAFGAGSGGTTTLVAANAIYEIGGARLGVLGDVRPHVGLGLGLLHSSADIGGRSGTDLVLNPAYGLTFDPAPVRPLLRALTAGGVVPALLVEHQGVALFDVNRLVLGISWRR